MSILKPITSGGGSSGGGAWEVVSDEVFTDVNEVEFTGLEVDATYKIEFSVQPNAGDEFGCIFENDTSTGAYAYQYNNGENGSSIASEDTSDPSFKIQRLGTGQKCGGTITINRLSATQPQQIGASLWSQASNTNMQNYSVSGVYTGSETITSIQLGYRDWLVVGNSARTMTGRITLLKLGTV